MVHGYNLKDVSFLIVDDCKFMRQTLRAVLKSLQVGEIHEAGNGLEAYKFLLTGIKPGIILADWVMPVMNGIELTHMIRTAHDSPCPYVPIILISAHGEASKVLEARDAGINEFLIKPISAKALYQRVSKIIAKPRLFVNSSDFLGPDRRRRDGDNNNGECRRGEQPNPICA